MSPTIPGRFSDVSSCPVVTLCASVRQACAAHTGLFFKRSRIRRGLTSLHTAGTCVRIMSFHWLLCLQAAKAEAVEQMEELLQEAGMQDILALPKARVPVIKFVVGATGTKVVRPGLWRDPSACCYMQWHCNASCGSASHAGLGTRLSQLVLLDP